MVVLGEPMKMAMVTVDNTLPSRLVLEQLSGNLTALLPRLSVSDNFLVFLS